MERDDDCLFDLELGLVPDVGAGDSVSPVCATGVTGNGDNITRGEFEFGKWVARHKGCAKEIHAMYVKDDEFSLLRFSEEELRAQQERFSDEGATLSSENPPEELSLDLSREGNKASPNDQVRHNQKPCQINTIEAPIEPQATSRDYQSGGKAPVLGDGDQERAINSPIAGPNSVFGRPERFLNMARGQLPEEVQREDRVDPIRCCFPCW